MRTPQKLVNQRTGEIYYRVRYRRDGKQRALCLYVRPVIDRKILKSDRICPH